MFLSESKLNTNLVVKKIKAEQADKLRLMELGLYDGVNILVKHKSLMKKDLLIFFNNSCFVIGVDLAKNIEVEYA